MFNKLHDFSFLNSQQGFKDIDTKLSHTDAKLETSGRVVSFKRHMAWKETVNFICLNVKQFNGSRKL